ncbi:MEKHLA domain-containing protein [Escherichia coli]
MDAAGRRFPIAEGIVWQLIGEDGAVRDQAATFPVPADRR